MEKSKQRLLDERYLRMARVWAENSYCQRRRVGALLVKEQAIISDGYNGTPSGFENICEDENNRTKPYVLHAEANAIIAASREQMLGSTLYMVCVDAKTRELVPGTSSCMMCKRQVINAGIETVIIRDTPGEYRVIPVREWIENDESLEGVFGY